jgi:hypothetical protein
MLLLIYCNDLFNRNPPNPYNSDIIPSIQLYVSRFLNGEFPYLPMKFDWTVFPNYFSLRWLPFLLPHIFHIDYRWLPISIYFIVLFYSIKQVNLFRNKDFFLIIIVLLTIVWVCVLHFQNFEFVNSIEFLIVAYYCLLIPVFHSKSIFWIGISVSLCLFSRQSIIFLLPAISYFLFYQFGWRSFVKYSFLVLSIGILTMMPFLLYDSGKSFIKGLDYYVISARGIWNTFSWQAANDIPHHLSHGLSYALYAFKLWPDNIDKAFSYFYKFQWIVHLGLGILCMMIIYKSPKISTMALITKLYIGLFFNFFCAPFLYLYFVPLFVSLHIFIYLSGLKDKNN